MQKYLYLSQAELLMLGHQTLTVGSSTLRIDQHLTSRNLVVDTPESSRPTPASVLSMRRGIGIVADHIRAVRPDVVHFVNKHVWNYPLLRKLRKELPATKFVHTFHDPVGHDGDAVQRGVIAYHRLTQRLLDGVIVHSDVAREQTAEVLQPKCPVFEAPLGVTEWRSAGAAPSPAAGYALIFGRLNNYKGCELYPSIIRATHRRDRSVSFVIAGNPSSDLSHEILDEIRSCPNVRLEDRFIDESEVDTLFAGASVVLMPYTSITQSGVLLEAYCRSLPVIAFDIEGMGDFLPDPGSLVPSFDTQAYAEAVVEHIQSPSLARTRGRLAWEFASERFTPAAMAAAFDQAYVSVTSPASSGPAAGSATGDPHIDQSM